MKRLLALLICMAMLLALACPISADELSASFVLTVNYVDTALNAVAAPVSIIFDEVINVSNVPINTVTGFDISYCDEGVYADLIEITDGYLAVNSVYDNVTVNVVLVPGADLTPVLDKVVSVTYCDELGNVLGVTDTGAVYTDGVNSYVLAASYVYNSVVYYPVGGMAVVSENVSTVNVQPLTDTENSEGETSGNGAEEGSEPPAEGETVVTPPAVETVITYSATVSCKPAVSVIANYNYNATYLESVGSTAVLKETSNTQCAVFEAKEEIAVLNESGEDRYALVDLYGNATLLSKISNFDVNATNEVTFYYELMPKVGSLVITRSSWKMDVRHYRIECTDAGYAAEVAIIGSGSLMVSDLVPGIYTVTDLSAYNRTGIADVQTVEVKAYEAEASVSFGDIDSALEDTGVSTKWLSATSNIAKIILTPNTTVN